MSGWQTLKSYKSERSWINLGTVKLPCARHIILKYMGSSLKLLSPFVLFICSFNRRIKLWPNKIACVHLACLQSCWRRYCWHAQYTQLVTQVFHYSNLLDHYDEIIAEGINKILTSRPKHLKHHPDWLCTL